MNSNTGKAFVFLTFSLLSLNARSGEFDSRYFENSNQKYEASKTEEFKEFENSVATAYCEIEHAAYYMEHYDFFQYKADDYAKKALDELNDIGGRNPNTSMPTHPFLQKHHSMRALNELEAAKKKAQEAYDYINGLSLYVGQVGKVKKNYVEPIKEKLKGIVEYYWLEEIYGRINACDNGQFD